MKLETVIGLEIHVQLKTVSKMFCACSNSGDQEPPNTTVCPICLGHPGTLPVANREAIEAGIRASLAIGCSINEESKFDRKHYFYPDLPKGYQISQFDKPVGINGEVEFDVPGKGSKSVRIERLHLEEDAAKNLHDKKGITLVDFNRAGTPLAEIVTHPDFRTPGEAKAFLQELRLIMRTLGVSDADMEKGNLRCDANISLRPDGSDELHPKTEIKNLNSFKSVERALTYEIKRQTDLWHTHTPPAETTTRGWNEQKQSTYEQRGKEAAHDYRYFPEPDIPPMLLRQMAQDAVRHLPELPRQRRQRMQDEYKFKPSDAKLLVDSPFLASFAENVMSECVAWLISLPEVEGDADEIKEKNGEKLGKLVGGWLTSKLLGILSDKNITISDAKVTPENFAELMSLIFTNQISSSVAQKMLEIMVDTGKDPSHILEEEGWGQISDESSLQDEVDRIIRQNPDAVEKYKSGKKQLLQFLVGMVMKATEGKANPEIVKEMLEKKLK